MGRLSGCCCCFGLRDGARAVGITLLVFYSLALVSTIVATEILLDDDGDDGDDVPITGADVVQRLLYYGWVILSLVMNALLVHGVNERMRGKILSWLIFFGIIFGLKSAAAAIGFIVVCIYAPWWASLLLLGVGGPIVGVFWYWFVVVLHYYQDLRENNGFVYGRHDNEGERHAL